MGPYHGYGLFFFGKYGVMDSCFQSFYHQHIYYIYSYGHPWCNGSMPEKEIENIKAIVFADLDELDTRLTYHSRAHTEDVYKQSVRIAEAEGIGKEEMRLLRLAALFHDTGFLRTYANHEVMSCRIFLEKSAGLHLTEQEKTVITDLIMATKLPQQPHTHLQRIICDADLDYLGREDFFEIGDLLRREFLHYGIVSSNEAWEAMQLKFLTNHQYHTQCSRELREPVKQENLRKLNGKG